MKTHRLFSLLVLGLLTTACAPVIYETPYASQPVYQDSYAYPVPVVVQVDQWHKARIEQELSNRHRRAAAIYRGEGRPGELVEVYIQGGYFNHQGRRINYSPATFRIATGDIVRFPASGTDLELYVRFENGYLAMDTDVFGSFSYTRLDFNLATDNRRERNYRLSNDHIRDAQVVVRAVTPNGRHDNRPYDGSRQAVEVKRNQPAPKHQVYQDSARHDQVQKRTRVNVERPQIVRSVSKTQKTTVKVTPVARTDRDRQQNLARQQQDDHFGKKNQKATPAVKEDRTSVRRDQGTRSEQVNNEARDNNRNIVRGEQSNSAKRVAGADKKQDKQEKSSVKKRQGGSDKDKEDVQLASNKDQEQKPNLKELLKSRINEARAIIRNR